MSHTIKNRIKIVLAKQEKTNRWLAEKIGKDETTIFRWCTNKVQATLQTLGNIAAVLNVDIHELIAPSHLKTKNQEL
ncbi:MAG: helix-turn-helix transcriptional regulator [Bacteroidales bacterium]